MLSLAFESFWLWYLAGVVLWAFVGTMTAAWSNLPPVAGFFAGAVGWFIGVAVVLVVGLIRRSATQPESRLSSTTWPSATSPAAIPVTVSPGSRVDAFGLPLPDPVVASPVRVARRTGPASRADVVCALAVLAGLAGLVSIVLPWGEGNVAWADDSAIGGEVTPVTVAPVALSIGTSVAALVAAAILVRRRPHPVWPIVAAFATTFWLCVVGQLLLVDDIANSWADTANTAASGAAHLSVGTSAGLWSMVAFCVLAVSWCALAGADVVRMPRSIHRPLTSS